MTKLITVACGNVIGMPCLIFLFVFKYFSLGFIASGHGDTGLAGTSSNNESIF